MLVEEEESLLRMIPDDFFQEECGKAFNFE